MSNRIVLMPGAGHFDCDRLRPVAIEFGLGTEEISNPLEVAPNDPQGIAAVLFHRDAFGPECSWAEALRRLSGVLPGVPLIPCHGFAEPLNPEELSDIGAWHSLWLPFDDNELRQCLGFIWQAKKRATDTVTRISSARSQMPARSTAA